MKTPKEIADEIVFDAPDQQYDPDQSILSDLIAAAIQAERDECAKVKARADKAELELWKETERRFPIMEGPPIPWRLIAPHEAQALKNHQQTLERLASRGGLSPTEAVAVLESREWRKMDRQAAIARLKELCS